MLMRYLILNADDFGYSEEVNAAILRSHLEGVLTSASLMVGEPACEQAVEIARQTPTLGVGLHLTVTYDRALLPPREIPLLVNAQGRFGADPFPVAWRYFWNRGAQAQLRREMEAQFTRFAHFGLPWSHVDGHQHFHLHPTVWDTLLDLCDAHNVLCLRVPREDTRAHFRQGREDKETGNREQGTGNRGEDGRRKTEDGRGSIENRKSKIENRIEGFSLNTISSLFLRLLRRRNLRVLRERKTLGGKPAFFCERVYGQLQTGNMHESYMLALLDRLHAYTNEIYFHPGSPHARPLPAALQREGVRDVELHTLLSSAVRARIESLELQIGTYAQIEAANAQHNTVAKRMKMEIAANERE